ncbi:MAG: right-handed parallel beta-helix repeat-containing protein [Armatimonadota bacterium]|nr:right-handed parallel beta-helix repeat-containing protein [Armatimonadota bacterium]
MHCVLACVLAVCCGTMLPSAAFGAAYYVSPGGCDDNSGMAPDQAWRSLDKVNSITFRPGDQVLFEAGGRWSGQLKPRGSGAEGNPIVIAKYGEGARPRLDGEGAVDSTLLLEDVEYWRVSDLEITNKSPEPGGKRRGVNLVASDFGTVHDLHLKDLYIHDVTGDSDHNNGGADGINWINSGGEELTRFDGLLIEGCRIERCERNGIWGWSEYWIRKPWYPSLNVVIRDNVVEEVGLSGIVPIGCDGALVERNFVRNPSRAGTGIGIWFWSCENSIAQFNEVTGARGPHDGQAFDSDWNSQHNVFQYNYSHDNPGGFMLVCTYALGEYNLGCKGTVVRYNISENDGEEISTFLFAGPIEDTYVYGNTIYVGSDRDVLFLWFMDWEGWSKRTHLFNNIFHVAGKARHDLGEATGSVFDGNVWFGNHVGAPDDQHAITADPLLTHPGAGGTLKDPRLLGSLEGYKLRAGSPAIDAGVDFRPKYGVDAGRRDFFGTAVPQGEAFDIGAHEVVAATTSGATPAARP